MKIYCFFVYVFVIVYFSIHSIKKFKNEVSGDSDKHRGVQ